MKITKTTTYDVTFHVGYRENSEGGMRSGTYSGKSHNDLPSAIEELEEAQARDHHVDWEIITEVEKVVS